MKIEASGHLRDAFGSSQRDSPAFHVGFCGVHFSATPDSFFLYDNIANKGFDPIAQKPSVGPPSPESLLTSDFSPTQLWQVFIPCHE
jgi:hypothetical protein